MKGIEKMGSVSEDKAKAETRRERRRRKVMKGGKWSDE